MDKQDCRNLLALLGFKRVTSSRPFRVYNKNVPGRLIEACIEPHQLVVRLLWTAQTRKPPRRTLCSRIAYAAGDFNEQLQRTLEIMETA